MQKIILLLTVIAFTLNGFAQETVYPAKPQETSIAITNATIHTGTGNVITNGAVVFDKGKITYVGSAAQMPSAKTVIDAKGKHVYPGLILPNTDLGLKEVASGVRGANDYREIEENNASIHSIVAYNTDSKVINVLRSNGILLANIVPEGGLIGGASSVVQLDAWNWEDAAYKTDNGIHVYLPALVNRPNRFGGRMQQTERDEIKEGLERIEIIKQFFREAKAYLTNNSAKQTNLKFESVKGLFNKSQKLFVHADYVREMLIATDFVKDFGFDVVIVGATDSWRIAPLLKENNIAVILNQPHNLPVMMDDDVDQPYKTPFMLQKAGVLFAINDDHNESRYRNLMFNAGTAVAYGLTKEEALAAITLNAAKILGIDQTTGSIETGKDANIIISEGDILDMKSSIVTDAFIQGRKLDLTDKNKQLYERYKYKYSLK